MYYRLVESYALRGWQRMTGALVQRTDNRTRALSQMQFRLLLLCDGRTDLGKAALSTEEREILRQFLERGFIFSSGRPDPITPEQEYRYYNNRYVRSVLWSVTGRCNYRCRHCYMDAPAGALGELPREEALLVIDQMAACGIQRVDLTGGEPFVRADFWELADVMLDHGITIGKIYSNGWLVDDTLLDKFERRGIKPGFSFSYDGVGWHDWMRGVKGAEEAVLRAMRLCKTRGFPSSVEMCVHKGNRHTIRDTVKLLSEIGVPAIKVGHVSDTELWRANNEGNAYSDREYYEDMIAYIPQFFEDGCPMNVLLGGVIELRKGSPEFRVVVERYSGTDKALQCYLCGAARANSYITPDGRLLPCMPMTACKEQELFPKIADIGLQKGLSDSFFMEFVDRRVADLTAVNQKCSECPHVLRCGGGCRAAALEQSGDLLGADEDQCMLWNEGYVERIRRTAEDAIHRFPPKGAEHEAGKE